MVEAPYRVEFEEPLLCTDASRLPKMDLMEGIILDWAVMKEE